MKRKKIIFQIILGLILIVIGTGWYLYPSYREWKTQQDVDAVIERFDLPYMPETDTEQENTSETTENSQVPETTEKPDFMELYAEMNNYNNELVKKGQKLTDAWDFEQTPVNMSSLGSDNPAIGYIEVPDMDVRLPLYIGASYINMSRGAAVLSETSMPVGGQNTNCVICGHRGWKGSAYFRNIEDMKVGSLVFITNPWETLTYKAVSAKIIHSSELGNIFIQPGQDMVTLFSCYPYAHPGTPYRYVVYCERVEDAPSDIREVSSNGKKSLPVEGIKADKHVAAKEKALLFLEQTLRYFLPVVMILITVIFRIIRGKRRRGNPS